MNSRTQARRRRKGPSAFYKVFSSLILIAVIVGSSMYGAAFYKAHNMLSGTQVTLEDDPTIEPTRFDKEDTESFLVLGTDLSPQKKARGEFGRSDVMIVVILNKKDKQTTMLSIPRDSYVNIDYTGFNIPYGKTGLDQDKITHAYYFGSMDESNPNNGMRMSTNTVEDLVGVEIDHVVSLNFQGFVDFIDAVGGVEIDVPFSSEQKSYDASRETVQVEAGLQQLSGEEALAYVRNRYDDPRGDIGRGQRQMEVINAVLEQSLGTSLINNYDKVLKAVGDNMQTTLGPNDYMRLIEDVGALNNTVQYQLTGEGARGNDGHFYYFLNEPLLDEVRYRVQQADSGNEVEAMTETELESYMLDPSGITYEAQ
ncbi:LytR family transcriptional regulator [Exiguobacterium sp. SH0S7]|uniref:LCP family protein n=2 Tax=unclassified Exiguobacterium TaxID=2644629 RepID=UPI00104043F6|nr:LCP family protein [Exiguobacterium sp. SH0S7]TCI69272.1 LytR family transcriptional regulator [Exiguobacterium sp. SH0S7]